MKQLYPDSHIEIRGFQARHYETLLNIITLGRYRALVNTMVADMGIEPDHKIIDFGAGTGYNELFMEPYLSDEGGVLGLDVGSEVIEEFEEKFGNEGNFKVEKRRIDRTLPYNRKFDKVLISFVLHGLPQPARLRVLDNAFQVLKPDGELCIFDYGGVEYEQMPFYFRVPFSIVECDYAYDFLKRNWDDHLLEAGFDHPDPIKYAGGLIRLLKARK